MPSWPSSSSSFIRPSSCRRGHDHHHHQHLVACFYMMCDEEPIKLWVQLREPTGNPEAPRTNEHTGATPS
eukprot:9574048-Karenia_brevis.AAC.1